MGWPAVLGAAAQMGGQAGMNFGAGLMEDYFSRRLMDREYDYTQRYAKEMPSWQVEGLRRAGLNPILAATSGFRVGQSPVAKGGGGPRINPVDVNSALRTQAEVKQIEAQTEKLKAETTTEKLLRLPRFDQVRQMVAESETSSALKGQQLQESMLRMDEIVARVEKLKEEKNLVGAKAYLEERTKELYQILDELVGPLANRGTAKFADDMVNILFRAVVKALLK